MPIPIEEQTRLESISLVSYSIFADVEETTEYEKERIRLFKFLQSQVIAFLVRPLNLIKVLKLITHLSEYFIDYEIIGFLLQCYPY